MDAARRTSCSRSMYIEAPLLTRAVLHVCAARLRVRSPSDDDSERARTGREGRSRHDDEPPGVRGMRTAPLTAQARQDALDAMRGSAQRGSELDVLVIG